MTIADLDKQDRCKHLLDAPAPFVVGNLIDELRKYMMFVEALKSNKYSLMDEDWEIVNSLLAKHEI